MKIKNTIKLGQSLSVEELEDRYEMSAFAITDGLMEEDCKKNCNPDNSEQCVARCFGSCD